MRMGLLVGARSHAILLALIPCRRQSLTSFQAQTTVSCRGKAWLVGMQCQRTGGSLPDPPDPLSSGPVSKSCSTLAPGSPHKLYVESFFFLFCSPLLPRECYFLNTLGAKSCCSSTLPSQTMNEGTCCRENICLLRTAT